MRARPRGEAEVAWKAGGWSSVRPRSAREGVGFARGRQGVTAVCLGDNARVLAVPDPTHLILHHGPEQFAIERRLRRAAAKRQVNHLVGVDLFATAAARAVGTAEGRADVQAGA